MARWQLQCSGKAEEDHCKFCQSQLPDWRDALFKDVICDETPSSSRLSSPSPTPAESSEGSRGDEAQDSDGSGSDGSADADGSAMPARSSTPSPDASGRAPAGAPEGGVSRSSDRPPLNGPPARRASVDAGSPGPGSSAGDPGGSPALGDVKGDIIVKFNDMSFRCKVRTGQEGLEDFMAQIREKCGIPEDKMRCLNLTYRCKDPNTGSQMTLQGVNESAFDAAVLCSAAQDKIKQRKRASRDGGRRGAAEKPGAASNEASREKKASPNASALAPASSEPDSSSGGHSDGSAGATSTASGKTKQRERFFGTREDGGDAASTRPCPGSPGKSGRFEYRGCDATSTRARGRRSSLDEDPADVATREFLRGARRLSAPPPSSSGFGVASAGPSPSAGDEAPASRRRARKSPWPSFMRAWSGNEA